MLLGQDGGGHQNGGLLAVQHAFHHRPEGHLRFAVAHVAAKQPVHGPGLFHVLFDLLNGPELVVGLRVGEGVLKLPLPGGVGGEGETGAALPLGVQLGQALGKVLGRFFRLGFLPGPLRTAQLVQLLALLVLTAADVLAHQVQLGDGDVQAVAPGVVDFDVVLFHAIHRHPLDAREPAHAVVDVDHQVAGGEVGVGLDFLAVGFLLQLQPLLRGGGELALGQHRQLQVRPLAACRQSPQGDADLPGFGHGCVFQVHRGGDAPLLQQTVEVVGPALPGAQHQHGAAVCAVMLQVGDGGLQTAAVGRELPGVHGQQAPGFQGMPGGREGVRHDDGEVLQGGVQLLTGEQELGVVARQQARFQQGLRVLLVLEQGVFYPLVHPAALAEEHHRVAGQIVDAGGDFRVDGGKIAVHAAGDSAVF